MRFLTHIPSPPLAEFVDFFWYYDGYNPQHTMEKLLPAGDIELVIDLDDCPKRLFDKEDQNRYEYKKRCWISGMQSDYLIIEATPQSSMMGVHFKPGGAHPVFKFSIEEMLNSVIELEDIWGHQIKSCWERLMETPGPAQKFEVLEGFLIRQLSDKVERNPIIDTTLPYLQQAGEMPSIGTLAQKARVSHKHLIRTYNKVVGMRPKLLSRIYKFQKTIQMLEQNKGIQWTALAYECGYYDQAHFIKEFKSFSGFNPSTYLDRHGDYVNYIPLDRV